METGALDPFDDAQMRAFYDVTWRAEMEDGRPWNIHWTHDELAASLRESPDDHKMEGVQVLGDDGTVMAAGVIGYGLLDNTDKAWVYPMVDPPRRRHGHGTTLLEGLIARCHELGRSTVTMNASYAGPEDDDAVPVRFAAANGFHVANTEIFRRLRLPVDDAVLDEVDADSLAHREGYTIETYVDEIPDHLLESYCDLVNLLIVDAPTGEVDYEASATTPETTKQRFAQHRKVGRTVFYSLAVKDGEAVAQSDLAVQAGDTHKALQWATFVHRDHRGHRLGAAVKVANLRALQRQRPDVVQVDTENAETNEHMVSINERLGFEIVAVSPSFVRRFGQDQD
jgi:GNAT superfamily N-acetyltransferase